MVPPLLVTAIVHAVVTLFLTGLIWFVQVVHYPLLRRVDARVYPDYQRLHERRTGLVVAPAMILEVATAAALALLGWSALPPFELLIGLLLLAAIWLSTFLLQVPRHRRLRRGFDDGAHLFLVRSNWVRTVGWSLRSVVAMRLLLSAAAATAG